MTSEYVIAFSLGEGAKRVSYEVHQHESYWHKVVSVRRIVDSRISSEAGSLIANDEGKILNVYHGFGEPNELELVVLATWYGRTKEAEAVFSLERNEYPQAE